jgi:long-chain alkane monooxygenase
LGGSCQPAEEAKINAVLFTDVLGVQGEFNGSRDVVFEQAVNVPIGDCSMLISALARARPATFDSVHEFGYPAYSFVFARMVSTPDHLSNGRIGWNTVEVLNTVGSISPTGLGDWNIGSTRLRCVAE